MKPLDEFQIPADARRTRTMLIFRDRFLRILFLDRAEVRIDDARECITISRELFGTGPALPVNVDMRRIRSQTAEARSYLSNPDGILITPGLGIVVASPLSRMIGNFLIGLNRGPAPTRLFSTIKASEDWLEGLLPASAPA